MFIGLVEATGRVVRVQAAGTGRRVLIERPEAFDSPAGASVCVSGVCLTVAGGGPGMGFDLSAETLSRTWFEGLKEGRRVNLERAMRLGDRLDGHLVSGHVDGKGDVVGLEEEGDGGKRLVCEMERGLERYVIDKGSVALDGVSLTVCEPEGRRFTVALIPATLERTTLGEARVGTVVNVEVDMIAKWVERLAGGPAAATPRADARRRH